MHTKVTEQSAASIFRTALKGSNRTLRNICTYLENYTGRHVFLTCWSENLQFYNSKHLQLCRSFAAYNQQDATFHNLFMSVRRSTCFRRFFRPSSGAQNCTYSVRYLLDCNNIVKTKLLVTVYINCSGK